MHAQISNAFQTLNFFFLCNYKVDVIASLFSQPLLVAPTNESGNFKGKIKYWMLTLITTTIKVNNTLGLHYSVV
jgi:hypothetical protein